MEAVVARTVSLGLRFPEIVTFQRVIRARWATHLDVGGGATNQGRDTCSFMRVFGECRHEWQINVHVGIDKTREDELTRSLDRFCSRRNGKILPDSSDDLVLDVN